MVEKLTKNMKILGIEVISTGIVAVDHMSGMGTRIDEEALTKCRELGKAVAETLVKLRKQ